MTTGPGCSAFLRIRSATSGNYEESSFSPSKGVPALMRSTVRIAGKAIEKSVVTEYATKTIRTDTITAEGESFTRKVQWKYLHDIEVHAEYHPGVRMLTICKGGKKVAAFETTGSYTTAGFRTVTKALDGYPKSFIINGNKSISEQTTFSPVQILSGGMYGPTSPPAGTSVVTSTPNNDGSITVTQTATSAEGQYVNTVTIGSDSLVSSQQIDTSTTTTEGGVTTSEGTHIETDGTGNGSYSESQAGTTPSGGFWVNSSTTDTTNGTSQSRQLITSHHDNKLGRKLQYDNDHDRRKWKYKYHLPRLQQRRHPKGPPNNIRQRARPPHLSHRQQRIPIRRRQRLQHQLLRRAQPRRQRRRPEPHGPEPHRARRQRAVGVAGRDGPVPGRQRGRDPDRQQGRPAALRSDRVGHQQRRDGRWVPGGHGDRDRPRAVCAAPRPRPRLEPARHGCGAGGELGAGGGERGGCCGGEGGGGLEGRVEEGREAAGSWGGGQGGGLVLDCISSSDVDFVLFACLL